MIRKIVIAALIILGIVLISSSLYTVDETKQVIIVQMGKYQTTVDDPGLHFKIPFIQSIVEFESRVLMSDAPATGYLTMDKKNIIVDHITRWKIGDPHLFYKTMKDEIGARQKLQAVVVSELRDAVASHNFVDIISTDRDTIMDSVSLATRQEALQFGMDVIDVRIKRADLPKEVQDNVFERMMAERAREAMEYRAEGTEEALEVEAEADKEAIIILAEAERTSQMLRGEGDAQATAIYAVAYSQDPEFYNLFRTLDTYNLFMDSETTLVLNSDSDLFKYFSGAKLDQESDSAPQETPQETPQE